MRRSGGVEGNDRLTSAVGLVLLVALAVEALTTLDLRQYLADHIFLGLLLTSPVALKLASTGWRFLRYYARHRAYVAAGPPQILMRALAPLLTASTLVLFGSGVAFLVTGDHGGALLSIHAVSFGVWGVVVSLHVLVYLRHAVERGIADWRPGRRLGAAGWRRGVLVAAFVAGVVAAVATLSIRDAWLRHGGHGGGRAVPGRSGQAPAPTASRSISGA